MSRTKHYRIRASRDLGDTIEDCSTPEVLGDAQFARYNSMRLAEEHAEEMQGEIADYELDPRTRYYVEEV
jgi:hypothetical protein